MKWLAILIASAGGAGYAPIAPGTWGTLVGCFLVFGINQICPPESIVYFLVGVGCILSIASHRLIPFLPSSWIHDDGKIVIDEVIGLFVTMLFIPITYQNIFIGFLLFRVFDIWKPLGIRRFDNMNKNWAVILDDVLAGVYANILFRIVLLFLPML